MTEIKKQEENALGDFINSLKFTVRHRKGLTLFNKQIDEVEVFGKTIYLENEIPGIVLDVFDNLGFVTKDGRKPLIRSKRKTESGWYLVINLPPGISFKQIKNKQNFFSDATNSWMDLQWINGCVHMDIQGAELPTEIPYEWDPTAYLKDMALPIPIGYSHKGIEVIDLAKSPHFLGGGATNYGKSSLISCCIHSLLKLPLYGRQVFVCVIDRKMLDFYYLRDHVLLAETEEDSLKLLNVLWKEHLRRIGILKRAGVKKISQYKGDDLPYIVCVIDEFAELHDKESNAIIDSLVRLSRACGIHLIAATQRPSITGGVMTGDTRAQFPSRICFYVSSETDSRMILGEEYSDAAWLPQIPGRALLKHDGVKLVQTMFIDEKMEQDLLENLEPRGRWGFEQQTKRLLPR